MGKLVEIKLTKGYVYGLCTHDLETSGQVLQLYKDQYALPLDKPKATLSGALIRTFIKFPLKHVLKEPEVRLIGSKSLNAQEKTLPIFRSLGLFSQGEKPKGWWIIDGSDERWVDALTQEMAHYPDDGIPNLAAIQELYELDLYPHSLSCLERGPLAFNLTKLQ